MKSTKTKKGAVPRILVADDDREVLELVRTSLTNAGFEVVTAHDGVEALDIARKQQFSLIILDVMIPYLDGYHVAAEISVNPQAAPVMLFTPRNFDSDGPAIQGSGAAAFLAKPFEISELLGAIRGVLTEGKPKLRRRI